MPASTLSIPEIKNQILQRARERQAAITSGQYDVPLRYTPLPLTELLDFLSQWDYRRDALALAVPPPQKGLGAAFNRFCKDLVCKSLRWLLIRQVEFNSAAIRHAQVLADFLAAVDRTQAELLAALTSLKLQVFAQSERIASLEKSRPAEPDIEKPADDADAARDLQVYSTYLDLLKSSFTRIHGPVLVLGCGRGDLLRFLVSEGIAARGIDPDVQHVEYCRERELPAVHAELMGYLAALGDASVGGITLGRRTCRMPALQLGELVGRCWMKLKKGAALIAEAENPLPVELMSFLFESHCFRLCDTVFSGPADSEFPSIIRPTAGQPFDRKHYRHYAVAGRK